MSPDKLFEEALDAIAEGNKDRGRELLTRLLRSDPNQAEYWLWMSTLVETQNERVYCLESALRVDPENEAARRGLIILGARTADPNTPPATIVRRRWASDLDKELEPPKTFLQRVWDNPVTRVITLVGALVLVVGLILAGVYGTRLARSQIAAVPTPTMIRVSPFPTRTTAPSETPTPTNTLVVRSPTPTFIGPTPLWMFLEATYTPVPLYVNTPHPVIEAYRAAVRAYERGDYQSMKEFLGQALQADPNSPDLYYYLGEAHRNLGEYEEALDAYQQALALKVNFAPAYLGRARVNLALDPQADVSADLQLAIDHDPYMVAPYLERAAYYIRQNEPDLALEDLVLAESLFPGMPMIYLLSAQIYLLQGDLENALDYAETANELDSTLLPTYLTLAETYLAVEDLDAAYKTVRIYINYAPDDPKGWLTYGLVFFMGKEDYDSAINAFEEALALDDEYALAYRYRGLSYLEMGDTQEAVNDLVTAVNLEPSNFDTSIYLAHALWADARLTTAYRQFVSAEMIATTDEQRAISYFYRAQVAELAGNLLDARSDWQALLELPEEAASEDMLEMARERFLALNLTLFPPTGTPTETATREPTRTITPTATRRPTITPSPTVTPTPTNTPEITLPP
ncbi:MAG: tetratricopeptide repeat protein [Anaerolineales bacterium]|nr:tetratricopeptide repeat protein [Anaerolineales bacterium]